MGKFIGQVVINTDRCKGCELCVVACPYDVLALQPTEVNDRGYHYAYTAQADKCVGCAACAAVCPDACITVYRALNPDHDKHTAQ